MLKQGTKLVKKIEGFAEEYHKGEEYHIGGICGEVYFIISEKTGICTSTRTEKEILEYFTIIEEKWEPEDGGKYWYIDSSGDICATWWQKNKHDLFRRDYLGIYQTKEGAQTALENMKKIS